MSRENILLAPSNVSLSDPRIERFTELNGLPVRELFADEMK